MATKIPRFDYCEAHRRFYVMEPPPLDTSGPTWKDLALHDSEVEQVPREPLIDWPLVAFWGVLSFLLGMFWGGVKFAALMLSPFI